MSLPYPESTTLAALAQSLRDESIERMFAEDPDRASAFCVEAAGLRLDYSRNLLSRQAVAQLLSLAASANLGEGRKALFDGSILNRTEGRAVAHTLLRASQAPPELAMEHTAITECLAKMALWVSRVQSGAHRGFSGQPIKHVVNLGIGGSDLGPRMACQALSGYNQPGLTVHFCANIDPTELQETLEKLNPESTLFIVCSKTLSTEETLANAQSARIWLLQAGCPVDNIDRHLLAVSSNLDAAMTLGIPESNVLPMWDWVGGRYSLWSGIGWSIAFAVGSDNFSELLAGAEAMDQHFISTPLGASMPVLLSLLEIWQVNFLGSRSHAVVPYSHRLRRFPAFLQQLTMESNGKRVNHKGEPVAYTTAPVVWGDEGTNSQHSFQQLLHQGNIDCPVDIILQLEGDTPGDDSHMRLLANGLAQARALMVGRDEAASREQLLAAGLSEKQATALAPHLVIPGNRPANVISFNQLTPRTLGALIALYEHRTFCSGHIWQINSYDQYGVELGKVLSREIYEAINSTANTFDAATRTLIERLKTL